MKRFFRHFSFWAGPALLLLVFAFWSFIGPWPLDQRAFFTQPYAVQTFQRIATAIPLKGRGDFWGGAASVDITPPAGVPLAGYAARDPKANIGMRDPVYAKALSLRSGTATITVLSADILLPLPELVEAVLKQTGLRREEIYFTSTHTHSGPGGYDSHWLNQFALGEFNPAYFSHLVYALSEAVRLSRTDMQPATFRYIEQRPAHSALRGLIRNSFDKHQQSPGVLHLLQLVSVDSDEAIASLTGFDAHPTLLGKQNLKISGDYPGQLQWLLESSWGGQVLFSAGAMGGAKLGEPIELRDLNSDSRLGLIAERIGEAYELLLDEPEVLENISQWQSSEGSIASLVLPVSLPGPSLQLSENLRVSPFLTRQFHAGKTYLHALRIGPVLLLGYPADYSIELARRLEQESAELGIHAWATSFNGDYLGYLMPVSRYQTPQYETREASLYGPWAGEYFHQLSMALVRRLNSDITP